jgi:hypothetical protein
MLRDLFNQFASKEDDTPGDTFMKFLTLSVSVCCCICGALWFLLYWKIFGLGLTAYLPLSFVIIVGASIVLAHVLKNHKILAFSQVFCITWISALISWSIGSIENSGLVIAWSFLGPVSAMIFFNKTRALGMMVICISILLVSAIFEPQLSKEVVEVPNSIRSLFYIMNVGASTGVIFLALVFFSEFQHNKGGTA